MTLEEKAKDLVDKYYSVCGGVYLGSTNKQCALIAVDEIKEYISENLLNEDSAIHIIYLNKLQQKIKDL